MALDDDLQQLFEASDFKDLLNKASEKTDIMESLIIGWRNHNGEVSWKSAAHDPAHVIHIAQCIIHDTLNADFKEGAE